MLVVSGLRGLVLVVSGLRGLVLVVSGFDMFDSVERRIVSPADMAAVLLV